MNRRALTLIELLLALVLLSAVTVAVATWIEVSARTVATIDEPIQWNHAASEVLRLIEEDLRRVSPAVVADHQQDHRSIDRITIDTNRLVIRPAPGSVHESTKHVQLAVYERNPMTKTLKRTLRNDQARPLLDGVEVFEAAIIDGESEVTVRIRSQFGHELQRRFILP